jgi:hypothetical protein
MIDSDKRPKPKLTTETVDGEVRIIKLSDSQKLDYIIELLEKK